MASIVYDVFLSYHSADRPAVRELYRRLTEAKIACFFDQADLVPGTRWRPELEKALEASAACAVCVGPAGRGPSPPRSGRGVPCGAEAGRDTGGRAP